MKKIFKPMAYTVAEFCKVHGISRALYYILKKNGQGPDEMRVRNRVLISVEAAKAWRERMTAATLEKQAENKGGKKN